MNFWESVRLALDTIRVQKLKSFFTLLGVMIGVIFLVAVVSIVEGMSRYMKEDFAAKLIGVNTFNVRRMPDFQFGNVSEATWREWQRRPRLYEPDITAIRAALGPDFRTAIENTEFLYSTTPYARPRQVMGIAADGDYFTIKKYNISSGRAFTQQEELLGLPVIVIGTEIAEHFFPNLDPVGRELRVKGVPFRVVGTIEKQGNILGFSMDRLAIAPYHSPMTRLTNPQGTIDQLIVQAPNEAAVDEGRETVRELMRSMRKLPPSKPDNFMLESSESALGFFNDLKSKLIVFGTALPAIGLVVGAMVIMNIMLVAVAERTREIGIRKALGARRRDIMGQFLVEAATLSVVGAAVGILLGIAGAKVISMLTPLPASVAPWSIVAALFVGAGVGITAGLYPASRASKLDPIAALRQE
jgi:putative ABC transport system permease protein